MGDGGVRSTLTRGVGKRIDFVQPGDEPGHARVVDREFHFGYV